MRERDQGIDYVYLIIFCLILLFGLIMLTSAGTAIGYSKFADRYYFIKRQLLYGVLPGLIALFAIIRLPPLWLKRLSLPFFGLNILLLVLVLIPGLGSSFGTGAQSWLSVLGYSFQPAELAKLATILFLAQFLATRGGEIQDLYRGFIPSLFVGFLPVGLIVLQPDVGTAAILFATVFGMLFFAGAKLKHLGAVTICGVLVLVLLIARAPYRADRLTTFLHPELHPQGIGYQINQAFLAIGSGGWFGLGFNHSRQKFQYLPEVHADSIFAIMAEEMGFLIMSGFLFLLLFLAYRGLRIGKQAGDSFGKLAASGIVIWLVIQSVLNVGAMVGLLPLTGVPLPFVSHGGTALLIAMTAIGCMLNISRTRGVTGETKSHRV